MNSGNDKALPAASGHQAAPAFNWQSYALGLREAIKPLVLDTGGHDVLRMKMAKSLSTEDRERFVEAVARARAAFDLLPDAALAALTRDAVASAGEDIVVAPDADERGCERRVQNFSVRAEPCREPDFVGEKKVLVTYNGRQEYPVNLAPHEARKLHDLLEVEFGFVAASRPAAGAPIRSDSPLVEAVGNFIAALDAAEGQTISLMSASLSQLRVVFRARDERGESPQASSSLVEAVHQLIEWFKSERGPMIPVTSPQIANVRAAYALGVEADEADLQEMMKEARQLLFEAAEPGATQRKADIGMCAQWDVDALALVERIDAENGDLRKMLVEASSLLDAAEPAATQAKADIGMCAQWDVDALALVKRIKAVIGE